MGRDIYSFLHFYAMRLWRRHTVLLGILMAAVSVFAITGFVLLEQTHEVAVANEELHMLTQRTAKSPVPSVGGARLNLPLFRSAPFIQLLNQSADDTHLALSEIVFALDDGPSQPFLRYRATLTVSGAYPAIRRFIDKVTLGPVEPVLDSIACIREDIAAASLSCELAMSAFYRKGV